MLCLPFSFLQWNAHTEEAVHYRILTAFLFAGIILTASRSAIAAATVIFILYIAIYQPNYRRWLKYISAIVLAILVLLTLVKLRGAHFFAERLNWWGTALHMFAAHPLAGAGWGNFGNSYLEFRSHAALNTLYAHNIFLQILAETGIPGILGFIAVIALAFRNGLSRATGGDTLSFIAMLSAGGFLLVNLVDYSFYIPAVQLLFWFSLGILMTRGGGPERKVTYLMPAMLFILLPVSYYIMVPFLASIHTQRGLYYLKQAEPLKALASFGRASALDPLPSLPYSRSAETYFALYASSRNPEFLHDAIEKEQAAVKRFPNNPRYWSDLSWLYRVAGDFDRALAAITNAIVYDRCNPAYRDVRRLLQERR